MFTMLLRFTTKLQCVLYGMSIRKPSRLKGGDSSVLLSPLFSVLVSGEFSAVLKDDFFTQPKSCNEISNCIL